MRTPCGDPAGHAANCGYWDCLAWLSERWLRDLDQVRTIASDVGQPMTFFCGGSRNFSKAIDLFDAVFVLDVDLVTLLRRLKQRPEHEFGESSQSETLWHCRIGRGRIAFWIAGFPTTQSSSTRVNRSRRSSMRSSGALRRSTGQGSCDNQEIRTYTLN
jgi:hypothetical protein